MRVSSFQKLTFLVIIGSHFGIIYVASTFVADRCGDYDGRHFGHMPYWRCNRRQRPRINACFHDQHGCSVSDGYHDCLLPQFECFNNGRCIPRSHICNGIPDCSDGSDEWGCRTASSGLTTSTTMRSEIVENTASYIITTSTVLLGNEEKTTSVILPESESITALSSSATTSTMLPDSESNTVLSSSTATSTVLPDSKSNTVLSSSTTTSTVLPDSKSNTVLSSSTTTSTMLPDAKSNIVLSSSTTKKTMLPDAASKTTFPSFVAESTMHPVYEDNNLSPISNTISLDSSAMQSCPDGYCRQLEVCIVVQGQYLCKCPPSFIGVCEMQRGTHENVVTIVLFMTLAFLCLAIISVGIYRYKRLSAWKSDYKSSRTLSQLTLTSNDVA